MEIITQSAEETAEFGKKLSTDLVGGEVFALVGDLGSGKTTFIQGFAKPLGIDRIISPTFILMRTYVIPAKAGIHTLYHLDLYRLENNIDQELQNLGFSEILDDKNAVTLIEWADKSRISMPKRTKWINFEHLEENNRKLTIK
jgi:tRNA threonylcarbamoyladenosine biosynthesis protein TsaE